MYSVEINLPTGVSFGRFGLRDMGTVLDYVRGAMKPGGRYGATGLSGATVTIDGPSDAGTYMVAGSPSGRRKLYKIASGDRTVRP